MVLPQEALHDLERRAVNCPEGGKSPCVCDGKLGIKVSENKCPDGKFVFSNPTNLQDGTMQKVSGGRTNELQCDHLVEAQFVAKQFVDGSAMCTHFLSAAGKTDFASFKKVLNTPAGGNFVFVDFNVNEAKGKFINPKVSNDKTTGVKKIALGVADYLTKTKTTAVSAAQALKDEMDRIATANGFQSQSFSADFVKDYGTLIDNTIAAYVRSSLVLSKSELTPTSLDRANTRAAQVPAIAPAPPRQPKPKAAPKKVTKPKKTTTKKTTTPANQAKAAQKVAAAKKKATIKKTAAAKKTAVKKKN
ncbi:hypothetical protein V5O48_008577 [Marasmius crinis-equi]|uniref:Uncharacterized protein n=1 Tax=Marasmius crinis-equi TaxID=585013 RepID=A0ABR3FDI3_9AGAR